MADIYEQHRAAFQSVSAYAIVSLTGERVASIAFKYPRDGAGRLYAYVHVFGLPMVRGFAGGGGYDKHSAAVEDAIRKIGDYTPEDMAKFPEEGQHVKKFKIILASVGGSTWDAELRAANYQVFQAV